MEARKPIYTIESVDWRQFKIEVKYFLDTVEACTRDKWEELTNISETELLGEDWEFYYQNVMSDNEWKKVEAKCKEIYSECLAREKEYLKEINYFN